MIVVDSSVAVAALIGNTAAQEGIATQRLAAPHLIDAEVAHALRGLVLGGLITESDAVAALQLWSRLAISRLPMAPLLGRIWELRANLTAYDAACVAAAEALDAPLVTADARLAAAPGLRCRTRLIGESG